MGEKQTPQQSRLAAGSQSGEGSAQEEAQQTLAEHQRVREELTKMQAPENAEELQAAVRQFQEQFKHAVKLQLRDGRTLEDAGLDSSGFLLLQHSSAVDDWNDREQVARVYYAEMAEKIKEMLGASHCFVNSHVIRKASPSGSEERTFPPFFEVHSDFTENYKEDLVRSLASGIEHTPTFGVLERLQKEGITCDDLRASRLLVLHVWRNVSDHPLRDSPLAVCDGRSVAPEDLIRERVRGLERYRSVHNPAHRWYWFSDMTKDEVLFFKGFDSSHAQYALHSAFCHGDVAADVSPRFSCELRAVCLIPET